jgi:lysophospholipase L1-like esterase
LTETVRLIGLVLAGSVVPWLLLTGQTALPSTPFLEHIKVVLVGDSTVATEGGWGPGFCSHLLPQADCVDVAANGRSTKSFFDEGLWSQALDLHGSFYFIQFGHNDQKDRPNLHTDPESTFKTNLERYIRDVRRIGAEPVLITPLTRRNFKAGHLLVDPLREYATAAREVAAEEHVPLIDLYRLSRNLIEPMTQSEADRFNMVHHEDAKAEGATATTPDRTHLNALGKQTFGDMVAQAVYNAVPALSPYIQIRPLHGQY